MLSIKLDSLHWDDFRLIRAIAAAGSLPLAADNLGINHSTVFRRLRQIEAAMGCALFEREQSRLVPSAPAEEIAALAARIGADVDAVAMKLAGQEPVPEGEVRVATNDSLLIHLLTPIFAEFRASCPRIRLDVVIGNPALNLSRRDADVAIRATDAPPDTLVGRKAARIAWALYGQHGKMEGPAAWVALGEGMGAMRVVAETLKLAGNEGPAYRVNSVLGLAEAIEAGIGIGYLPCFIADTKPGLTRLAEPEPAFAADLWLLTHPDLRRAARVRVLLDFLAGAIAKRRDLVEGRSAPPHSFTAPVIDET